MWIKKRLSRHAKDRDVRFMFLLLPTSSMKWSIVMVISCTKAPCGRRIDAYLWGCSHVNQKHVQTRHCCILLLCSAESFLTIKLIICLFLDWRKVLRLNLVVKPIVSRLWSFDPEYIPIHGHIQHIWSCFNPTVYGANVCVSTVLYRVSGCDPISRSPTWVQFTRTQVFTRHLKRCCR